MAHYETNYNLKMKNLFECEIVDLFNDRQRKSQYKALLKQYLHLPNTRYAIFNDNKQNPICQLTVFELKEYGWYAFMEAQYCGGQLERIEKGQIEILFKQINNYTDSVYTLDYLYLFKKSALTLVRSQGYDECFWTDLLKMFER